MSKERQSNKEPMKKAALSLKEKRVAKKEKKGNKSAFLASDKK